MSNVFEPETAKLRDGRQLILTDRLHWDETGTANGAPRKLLVIHPEEPDTDYREFLDGDEEELEAVFATILAQSQRIAELEQGQGWVAVGERVPEQWLSNGDSAEVLVFTEHERRFIAWYEHPLREWHSSTLPFPGKVHGVTHWRPLPVPPITPPHRSGQEKTDE